MSTGEKKSLESPHTVVTQCIVQSGCSVTLQHTAKVNIQLKPSKKVPYYSLFMNLNPSLNLPHLPPGGKVSRNGPERSSVKKKEEKGAVKIPY